MRAFISITALLVLCTPAREAEAASAQKVFVAEGNIVLTTGDDRSRRITKDGVDTEPTLSADGTSVVFVRKVKELTLPSGTYTEESQIWLADCSDDWTPHVIVKQSLLPSKFSSFTRFRAPQFSPDKSRVYFLVDQYSVVTPGLFYLERRVGNIKFFAPAWRYWVVPKGGYRAHLILEQNPAMVTGGRLEIYYLFSPRGEEVGIVGLSEDNVKYLMQSAEDSHDAN